MSISKITPILIVDSVEANLPFWRDQLSYEVVHTVPHGKTVGFVILKRADSEVMLQSAASVNEDVKFSEPLRAGSVVLYADVESLEQTTKSLKDGQFLIPRRQTDYGASESWIKTPSGTILGLSEFKK